MKKDARYFKHDSNARHDAKIKSLINKTGIEGYGRWWILVEMLRDASFYRLETKEYVWENIAEEMKVSIGDAKQFVDECIKRELLVQQDGFIYSISLLSRMNSLDDLRVKRVEAGRLGAESRWS